MHLLYAPCPMRRLFSGFEPSFGVVAMLLGGVLVVVGMIAGVITFGGLIGIGLVYGIGVGLICAVCRNGTTPNFCDPANVRNHWRGHVKAAGVIVFVGLVGAAVSTTL